MASCPVCSMSFDSLMDVNEHMAMVHMKFLRCPVCQANNFTSDYQLRVHVRAFHPSMKCHVCKVFRSRRKMELEIHVAKCKSTIPILKESKVSDDHSRRSLLKSAMAELKQQQQAIHCRGDTAKSQSPFSFLFACNKCEWKCICAKDMDQHLSLTHAHLDEPSDHQHVVVQRQEVDNAILQPELHHTQMDTTGKTDCTASSSSTAKVVTAPPPLTSTLSPTSTKTSLESEKKKCFKCGVCGFNALHRFQVVNHVISIHSKSEIKASRSTLNQL